MNDPVRAGASIRAQPGPRTWELEASASVIQLGCVPSSSRLSIRFGPHLRSVTIDAEAVQGNARLVLQFAGPPQQIRIRRAFQNVAIEAGLAGRCVLDLAGTRELLLPQGRWQLRDSHGDRDLPLHLTITGKGTRTQIDAGAPITLGQLKVFGQDEVTLACALANNVRLEAAGNLVVHPEVPPGGRISAQDVTLASGARALRRLCGRRVVSRQSISGTEARRAFVRAESFRVDGSLADVRARIKCQALVSGDLNRTHIRISEPEEVALVAGQPRDPRPCPPVSDRVEGDIVEPKWWTSPGGGSANDSRVSVEGQGSVVLGSVQGCQIRTEGDLQVIRKLRLDTLTFVEAGQGVWAGSVRVEDSDAALATPELLVLDSLSGTGRVRAAETVVVGGTITGGPGKGRSGRKDDSDPPAEGDGAIESGARTCPLSVATGRLRVVGAVRDSLLTSSESLMAEGKCDAGTVLDLKGQGDALLDGTVVRCTGTGQRALGFEGHIGALLLEEGAELELVPRGVWRLEEAKVAGDLTLRDAPKKLNVIRSRSGDPHSDVQVRWSSGGPKTEQPCEMRLLKGGTVGFLRGETPTLGAVSLKISAGDEWILMEAGAAAPEVRFEAPDSDGEGTREDALSIRARGRFDLVVIGEVHRFEALETEDGCPTLVVPDEGTAIREASGRIRLGSQIAGRIHGQSLQRTAQESLVVVGIEAQDAKVSRTGRVIHVDPTPIPYDELSHIDAIGVFDPHPRPLIRYAEGAPDLRRARKADREAGRAALRTRAERMTRLTAAIDQRALPGSSRAAAKWAAARLHHRSLPRSWERVWRWFHRQLGYSQRPGRPLCWWGVAILALGSVRLGWLARFGTELDGWLVAEAFWVAFTLPLRFLRLDPAEEVLLPPVDSALDPMMFIAGVINVVSFAVTALLVFFIVVATRNYLRTPGEGA